MDLMVVGGRSSEVGGADSIRIVGAEMCGRGAVSVLAGGS